MNSFSSFLELMAAFNFAYVLGQDYLKEILLKGLGITGRIKRRTEDRVSELNAICETLENQSTIDDDPRKQEAKSKITDDIILSLTKLKQKYKLDFNASIPFGFPQLCLISGILCIYSILVVSCNGSNVLLSSSKYSVTCHALFSAICLISYSAFLILTLHPKVNQWAIKNKNFVSINSTICYISGIILILIYCTVYLIPGISDWFEFEIQKELFFAKPAAMSIEEANNALKGFLVTEKVANYTFFSYLTILIIPTLHFVLFLLIASYKGRSYYGLFEKDFLNIENNYTQIRSNDDLILAADSRHRTNKKNGSYTIKTS